MTSRVASIDSRLEWELSLGRDADHALCVTAAGNPELRATAERWLRAGPQRSATWEYLSARAPHPDPFDASVSVAERQAALSDGLFVVSEADDRGVLDVVVYHPMLSGLLEPDQHRLMFRMVDSLLGEDTVECWIGGLAVSTLEPPDGIGPQQFVAAVEGQADAHRHPSWEVLDAHDRRGRRALVRVRWPLRPGLFPLFDLHGEIVYRFDRRARDGLPTSTQLPALEAVEQALAGLLEAGTGAVLAAIVTSNGVRRFHLYADPDSGIRRRVDAWVRDQPNAKSSWKRDSSWAAVGAYR